MTGVLAYNHWSRDDTWFAVDSLLRLDAQGWELFVKVRFKFGGKRGGAWVGPNPLPCIKPCKLFGSWAPPLQVCKKKNPSLILLQLIISPFFI
jgi:hypothetical protein